MAALTVNVKAKFPVVHEQKFKDFINIHKHCVVKREASSFLFHRPNLLRLGSSSFECFVLNLILSDLATLC